MLGSFRSPPQINFSLNLFAEGASSSRYSRHDFKRVNCTISEENTSYSLVRFQHLLVSPFPEQRSMCDRLKSFDNHPNEEQSEEKRLPEK